MDDKMLSAKLGFMQSIAMQLEPYLTKYQTNKSLLPFLYHDLYSRLRSLMIRFVKSDVMTGVSDASKLMAVDFSSKDNLKRLHDVDIGFAASADSWIHVDVLIMLIVVK